MVRNFNSTRYALSRYDYYSGRIRRYVPLAVAAYRGVQLIKSMINVEAHYILYNMGNTPVSSTAAVYHLSDIDAGDEIYERTGWSVLAKSLQYKMRFTNSDTSEAPPTFTRVIIFVDLSSCGTNPTADDVLADSTDLLSFQDNNSLDRFWILRDFVVSTNLDDRMNVVRHGYIRLNTHIKYEGNNGTQIGANQIYVLLLSNQATATPVVDMNTRLKFYDN